MILGKASPSAQPSSSRRSRRGCGDAVTRAEKIARCPRRYKRRPHNQRLVVKVQVSIATTEPVRQACIYNQDHSIEWMGNCSRATLRFMAGKLKRYAFAHLKGTQIVLDGYAPEQDW